MKRKTTLPRLKPRELRTAAIHCFENASDLLGDARLLLENGRIARASAIAAIGFEELGKARVCVGLLAENPDFKTYRKRASFWRFWKGHVGKGMHVFLRTVQDGNQVLRFSDRGKAVELGKSLVAIREMGLYVDARDGAPPTFPGEKPSKPVGGGEWPVSFLLPSRSRDRHASELIRDLALYLGDLTPRIESLKEARAEEGRKFAEAILKRLEEMREAMKMRAVRQASDFPKKPDRDFEIVVYGSDNPFLLRALSAHYGVAVKGWSVEPGKAERTLEQVLADTESAERELLVRGPGNVIIDVAVSTDPRLLNPGPNRFGIAFYEQPKAK